jgi:hypothetical protein
MADLKNVLREEAAQCRLLADMATEPTIKQALLAMATRLQAAADSEDNPTSSTKRPTSPSPIPS